ncbi:non-ribosomal peptide synthetase [Nocardia yunnanensis]|uniref:non-ribosomal peptide synthetase n=1 Tax=Nocardia yunnanensis TaxID=2382165 RepID=UPI0013C4DBD6|nr:amino acid adenylation domain-containing protein [Nocardia yunnanensis]
MTVRRRSITSAQRKLHTQQILFPEDPAFNVGFLLRIQGDIDIDRLRAALDNVARGAEPLNEYFVEYDGVVHAEYDPGLRYRTPLTELDGDAAEVLRAEISDRLDTPIPMDRWPLYSAEVFRDEVGVYLAIIASHMIADVSTFYNIIADLMLVYGSPEAALPGGSLFPADPVPDPARERAAVEFFGSTVGRLETLSVSEWEAARDRDGTLTGEHRTLELGSQLSADIDGAVEALGVRKFSFFLAVHLLVLGCLSAKQVVTTGVPLSNRRRDRRMIKAYGYHVNTLPLTVDLSGIDTFENLCLEVERQMGRLIEFEDFDLAEHAGEIFGSAEAGRTRPSSSFTFYKQRMSLSLPGYQIDPIPLSRTKSMFPFMANVEENDAGYTYHLQIGTALAHSHPEQVLRTVLSHMGARPGAKLAEVPWLDATALAEAGERTGILERIEPGFPSLTAQFEHQVARTPDAVAVGYEESHYTYAELDRRVNQVAHAILDTVGGDYVGVSMERSVDLVTVLLAVLKAGKAYVPIDPAAPPERVRSILERFESLPVIASRGALTDMPSMRRLDLRRVLQDATTRAATSPAGDENRHRRPAYVIFTSGSTGTPKGVTVTHANVLRLFASAGRSIEFGATDTWALFHSYAFDFAVWEMFGALLSGGRLMIVPEWTRRSPADFARFLAEERVTVLNQTPTAFRQLTQAMTDEHARSFAVRLIIFGGEMLRFESLDRWYELCGDKAELVNMYGITETTVHVTHYQISTEDLKAGRPSVIGKPLSDLGVVVVDAELRPVPAGVAGEMLIYGDGVGLGYLGRADLTAERFVRLPGSPHIHYRSGDLAKVDENGDLVYLGRIDQQVQLRGVRIELGEIEAAMLHLDGVRECAVRVDRRDPDEPELVAFLVQSRELDDAQLRRALRDRLPAAMRPTRFVRLNALPLTVNGKVAEAQLPWPDREYDHSPQAAAPAVEPSASDTLAIVRTAWSTALERDDFGDDDAFFDAGGTSIQLVRVLEALRSACERPESLEMVDLFEFTTPRQQAELLDRIRTRTATLVA